MLTQLRRTRSTIAPLLGASLLSLVATLLLAVPHAAAQNEAPAPDAPDDHNGSPLSIADLAAVSQRFADDVGQRRQAINARYQAWQSSDAKSGDPQKVALQSEFDSQLQANAGIFQEVSVQHGTGTHRFVKVTLNPSGTGSGVDAIRFRNGSSTHKDLVWAVAYTKKSLIIRWCITPVTGSMRCFQTFCTASGSEYPGMPWETLSDRHGLVLQPHTGSGIRAGEEYVIWFGFDEPGPKELFVAINLVPAGTPLANREQWEAALGLKRVPKPAAQVAKSDATAKRKSDAVSETATQAKKHLSQGIALFDKGEFDKAIAEHTEALRLNPNYASAYYNRNLAWGRKGQVDKAIADCNEAIRLAPNNGWYYSSRGANWLAKGDLAKAMSDCDKAIELSPTFAWARMNRGRVWLAKREYSKAVDDLTDAIRLDPKLALAYKYRAYARNGTRDYNGAYTDCVAAMKLDTQLQPELLRLQQDVFELSLYDEKSTLEALDEIYPGIATKQSGTQSNEWRSKRKLHTQ